MARRRTPRERADQLLERAALDYLAAAVAVGLLLLIVHYVPAADPFEMLTADERAETYSKVIGPLSIIASIATAALAVYAAAQGPRVTLMRTVFGKTLLRQFTGAAVAPALAVVALMVAYIAEKAYDGIPWPRWLFIGAVIFVLVRGARVLYYYKGLLLTAGEDKDPAPRLKSLDEQPLRAPES